MTFLDYPRAKLAKLARGLIVVQLDAVVRWHRDWLRRRLDATLAASTRRRPPIHQQIRALVRDMATANPLRGAPRIHRELRTIGVDLSVRTVSGLLESHTSRRSPLAREFTS